MKEVLVSDESVNSYGFRVLVAGIDTARFLRNPIMLFNHSRAMKGTTDQILPIGTWKDLRVEDGKLYATPEFDMEDEFAAKIAGKWERGVLRGTSIGIDIKQLVGENVGDREMPVVSKSQLMEISVADIPSNENSVAVYDENEQPLDKDAILALAASISNPPPPAKKTETKMSKFEFVPTSIGLAADASDEAVKAKLAELNGLAKTNEELSAKVEKFEAAEKARKEQEIVQLVDQAVKDNKIGAEEKDHYVKLGKLDRASVEAVLKAMSPRKKLAHIPKGPGAAKDDAGKLTFNGKTYDELWRAGELGQLKADNAELYAQMYENEFGKAPEA